MRLALITCANGLGHIKRLTKITRHLLERLPIQSVTFFCEEYALRELKSWHDFIYIADRVAVKMVNAALPLRWHLQQESYGEWLLKWHRTMLDWDLESFDHVLSDNLVEPLLYTDRVTLIGSFLWHEVLAAAFHDAEEIQRYREMCEELLLAKRPEMIASRYFAMPTVYQQTKVQEVGLIHFLPAGTTERSSHREKRALIALGGAPAGQRGMDELFAVVPLLQKAQIEVLASSPLHEKLSDQHSGIGRFDFLSDDFKSLDLAVTRGGLGTISDCVAAQVPMFYLDDPNPEISFNQDRLSQIGIGMPLQRLLQEDLKPLTDDRILGQMAWRMRELKLGGETEAADILADALRNSARS